MSNVNVDEFLEHHGIKGQKWGIRRFQNPDGSLTNAGRKRYGDSSGSEKSSSAQKRSFFGRKKSSSSSSSSEKEDATSKKKSVSEMSDEELRKAIDRLNLESRYLQLMQQTSSPKETVNRGKRFSNIARDKLKEGLGEGIKAGSSYVLASIAKSMIDNMIKSSNSNKKK